MILTDSNQSKFAIEYNRCPTSIRIIIMCQSGIRNDLCPSVRRIRNFTIWTFIRALSLTQEVSLTLGAPLGGSVLSSASQKKISTRPRLGQNSRRALKRTFSDKSIMLAVELWGDSLIFRTD